MWWMATVLASPWVPRPGEARLGVGFQQLVSERQFASPQAEGRLGPLCDGGVKAGQGFPYDCTTGGRFTNRSVLFDVNVGVVDGLALDLFLPVVVHGRFADTLGATDARGLGDLRLGARYGFTSGPWAIAAALHVKAPTGPPGLVDRDVPLGDAQWDVLPGVRVGISAHPWGWVELHNQLVVRLRSQRSGIDPGEEWTGSFGGGFTPVEWGGLQLRGEWILAARDIDAFGLKHPGRRLLAVRTGPFVQLDRWWIEGSAVVPIAGWRWPVAPAVGLSVAYRVGGPE